MGIKNIYERFIWFDSQVVAEGVMSLAQQALKAGATEEEIMEAIRVAQYICGVGCVYTAAHAFKDLFRN